MLLWLFRSTRVRSFRSSLSFSSPSFRSILFSPLLRIYLAFCRSAFSSLILPTFGSRSLDILDGFNDDDGLNFCGEPRMTWWPYYHMRVAASEGWFVSGISHLSGLSNVTVSRGGNYMQPASFFLSFQRCKRKSHINAYVLSRSFCMIVLVYWNTLEAKVLALFFLTLVYQMNIGSRFMAIYWFVAFQA